MQVVTADMIVFREIAPYCTEVLLIKRGNEPFKGMYAFPGGHLDKTDDVLN
jgi:ADP-ribose pyrophosphatase YjhB (NUDIX family)